MRDAVPRSEARLGAASSGLGGCSTGLGEGMQEVAEESMKRNTWWGVAESEFTFGGERRDWMGRCASIS